MAEDPVLIVPYRDGPYLIRGPVLLRDQTGAEIEPGRRVVALCRCGKSRLRPFCDGSHHLIHFRAPSEREDRVVAAAAARNSSEAEAGGNAGDGSREAPAEENLAQGDAVTADSPVQGGAVTADSPVQGDAAITKESPVQGEAVTVESELTALQGELLALRRRLLALPAETSEADPDLRVADAARLMAAASVALRAAERPSVQDDRG